jgi:hypothetical protein
LTSCSTCIAPCCTTRFSGCPYFCG